jgi:hypothetical protein
MRLLMRALSAAVFVGVMVVPVRNAPAQREIAPGPNDGPIQEWEGPHGTTTCHDLCGGENCCGSSTGMMSAPRRWTL